MKEKIIYLQNRLLGVTRYADVLLAVAVVLILSLMILPIPPFLLDLLLAANLSLSILLLVQPRELFAASAEEGAERSAETEETAASSAHDSTGRSDPELGTRSAAA